MINAHFWRDSVKDRGVHQQSVALISRHQSRPALLRVLDERGDGIRGALADDCPQRSFTFSRVAGDQRFRLIGQLFYKSVADRVVYDDALSGHTYLPLIHKRAERRGLYRLIQIRVVQNDQRRLSSTSAASSGAFVTTLTTPSGKPASRMISPIR